ncbi:methyltransferase [Spiribacter salinus M19-40]|uniref:Ribosomal RNA small subunit methyltransferase D n=1 Tax=Spiribacter salinus M19-40 TaxID=1260251 RepID=R4V2U0_9GAMM|nr:16S rRNA (guanine(966)-N(2))-methyltransferase RsmD [Spiribacter salinus]AGM40319.1 methyltransferase [Spiribacter salinus M19-40]MDR9413194.1 16S rRNA (guanine(966)-N(2))-methyltransferase RsmD [Spiribacter sp.]
MAGQLRIIGGVWGGRRLAVQGASGLRPTADRNRETLFNWLQWQVAGSRVLDLFAGTGALGIEALSRGAVEAVFVERARQPAMALRERLGDLDATERAEVIVADARQYLAGQARPFDLVFLDPPFDQALLAPVLERLALGDWLSPEALVYVESRERPDPGVLPPDWAVWREKRSGAVWYGLLATA